MSPTDYELRPPKPSEDPASDANGNAAPEAGSVPASEMVQAHAEAADASTPEDVLDDFPASEDFADQEDELPEDLDKWAEALSEPDDHLRPEAADLWALRRATSQSNPSARLTEGYGHGGRPLGASAAG